MIQNDNSIIKTAWFIKKDKENKSKLAEIKKSKKNTWENIALLQTIIYSKKLELHSVPDKLEQLLSNSILEKINSASEKSLSQSRKISQLSENSLLVQNFLDVVDQEFVLQALEKGMDFDGFLTRDVVILQEERVREIITKKDLESLVLGFTNSLYKKILFGNYTKQDFLKKTKKGQEFKFKGGQFCSMKDLCEKINKVSENEFKQHTKNKDFQNWMTNSFDDLGKYASAIENAQSKDEIIENLIKCAKNIEKRELRSEKNKIKNDMHMEYVIPAELFLDKFMNEKLVDLIAHPKSHIDSKEDLKLLKIIDKYIAESKKDVFRVELCSFLLDPFDFVEGHEEINRDFNFKEYFENQIAANIRLDSEINEIVKDIQEKGVTITSLADLDEYKEKRAKISDFVGQFKDMNLPDMQSVLASHTALNEHLKEMDDLLDEQKTEFAEASEEIAEALTALQQSLGKSPTNRNISAYNNSNYILLEFNPELKLTEEIVGEEYTSFVAVKKECNVLLKKREKEIKKYFDGLLKEKKDFLDTKTWDVQQEVDLLTDLLNEMHLKMNLSRAKTFYGDTDAEFLLLPQKISAIIDRYEEAREKNIEKIEQITSETDEIVDMLEDIIENPEMLTIDFKQFDTQITIYEEISNVDTEISEKENKIQPFNIDKGLAEAIQEFEEIKERAKDRLAKVIEIARRKIDEKDNELFEASVEPHTGYFHEISVFNDFIDDAEKLAELVQTINYSEKQEAVSTKIDIAKMTIYNIEYDFKEKKEKLKSIKDSINSDFQEIKQLYKRITEKDTLSEILSKISSWHQTLSDNEDLANDAAVKPYFKRAEDRVSNIEKQVDEKVTKKIQRTYEQAKELEKEIETPSKTRIIDTLKDLNNSMAQLDNLSKDKFADQTKAPKKDVNVLIGRAETCLANFRLELKKEVQDIDRELNKEYEWSSDITTISTWISQIEDLKKDAEDLQSEEQKALLLSAKKLAEEKIKETERRIEVKQKEIRDLIQENEEFNKNLLSELGESAAAEVIEIKDKALAAIHRKIKRYESWNKDSALSSLLAEAKEKIIRYENETKDAVLERINSLDNLVKIADRLSDKQELQPAEIQKVRKAVSALKRREKRYLLFNKNEFVDVITQKIKFLDNTKEKASNRIKKFTEQYDSRIKEIELFLDGDLQFSQQIPELETRKQETKDLFKYCSALDNLEFMERANTARVSIDANIDSIKNILKERKVMIADFSEQRTSAFEQVKKLLSGESGDEEIIPCYESLDTLETEIGLRIDWGNDDLFKDFFEESDSKIKQYKEGINNHILDRINIVDSVVYGVETLTKKKVFNLQETKELGKVDDLLENQKDKYRQLETGNFSQNVIDQKIEKVLEIQQETAKCIETVHNQKNSKLSDIAGFLEKGFRYSQHIKVHLRPKLEELEDIRKYSIALNDSDMLATVEELKSDIEENIAAINRRTDERLAQLKEKERNIALLSDAADDLFDEGIFADNVRQCYADVDSIASDVDSIDVDWKKDSKVLPECLALTPKVNALKSRLDKAIDERTVLIDEHVDKYKKVIEDIVLDSPDAVAELLAAEAQLDYALEDYSNLLVLRPKEFKRKEDRIQDIIEVFSDKIAAKKKELDEKLDLLERHRDSEYDFSQHQKTLEDDLEKNLVLEDYFCILRDNNNIERLLDLEEKIVSKIFDLQILYDERYEKAAPLKKQAEETEKEFEQVVQNIIEKESLKKSISLLKSLKEGIDEHAEIAADKSLYKEIFAGAKEIFERLKAELEGKGNEAISKLSRSVDFIKLMLPMHTMHYLDPVKRFMENKRQVDLIEEKLGIFQEAEDINFDLKYAYENLKPVQQMIYERIQEAKEDVDFVVDTRIDSLSRVDFKYLYQLYSLEEYKSELEEKRDICVLLDFDTRQVDSCIAQVDRRIEWLDVPYKDLVETLMDTEERLQFATRKINKLFKKDLDGQSFGFVLSVLEDARSAIDKAYSHNYIKEKEFDSQVYAVELLMGGLQSLVDERIEIELAKISNPAKDLISQIKKPETRQELGSLQELRSELEKVPEKLDIFNKDKYSGSVGEKKKQVFEGIELAKNMENKYLLELSDKLTKIEDSKKQLETLLSKVQEKESGLDYLSALTELGNEIKETDRIYNAWKKDDAIVTYFAKNLAGSMQEIEAETRRRQEELCVLLEAAITGYEENLARPWHSHEDVKKLNKWFSDFKTKSRPYLSFRNSILDNELFERITRRYIFAFQRVKKIKSEFRALVNAEKRAIDNLKRQATGFDDIRVQLSDLIDELPENHLDIVKHIDSYLRNLQKSVSQLNGRLIRTVAMENDVVELKTRTEKNTGYFAESIYNLEQALVQRRNLQRQGLPHNKGVTKFLMRKAKSLLSSSYKKDMAVLNELDDIKKYHEGLLADDPD